MIRRIILLIVFYSSLLSLRAQTKDRIVFGELIDKGDYYYIPKSALADSVQAIYYESKLETKASAATRPINLHWNSTCNDGSYGLTITPEQIFFSSSHDNPNPDYLFWVIDIDTLQFRQIRKGFQQKPPPGFENISKYYGKSLTAFYDGKFKDKFYVPGEWDDAAVKKQEAYCHIQIQKQLTRYLAIINSYISAPAKKIHFPLDEGRLIYFGSSKEEIKDWLPVKEDMPKRDD